MTFSLLPNERWSIDFAVDHVDGRRLRILGVVDDCTRECLALIADGSISGIRVAQSSSDCSSSAASQGQS